MVHTFELNHITNETKVIKVLVEHYELNEIQELLVKSKRKKNTIDIPISIPGLIAVSISYIGNECYRFYLRVEPQSLIAGRRTINVFDCAFGSVERLRPVLDESIEIISSTLPQSDRWFVSRIDFTKNLTSEYVRECVELAKKGKDPYRFKETIDKSGSSYRKSKSVILNYYDKLDHITKKVDNISFDNHLLEEAHNIYRIEVQCLNHKKLKHIREKFDLPRKSNLYDYLRTDIAEWAFFSYYDKVIGRGDYYSLAQVLKRIESTDLGSRKKKNIKNWLKLIAQAKGMTNAKKQFVDGTTLGRTQTVVQGCLDTFRSYEKVCEEIGVNPVAIPKDWGIDYIPNPINSLDSSKITENK
ncbi:hypothetical protein NSQ77_10775 [Oceanobacillus sp. FSL K6-2867]|uniref:hypothetical protein n=1 Tax=Oceanobacillus sp. FSL K6-2867 TaxID=2954748 RepID=UPI0030D71664